MESSVARYSHNQLRYSLGGCCNSFIVHICKHLNYGNTNTIFAVGNLAPGWFYLGGAHRRLSTTAMETWIVMRLPSSQHFPYWHDDYDDTAVEDILCMFLL